MTDLQFALGDQVMNRRLGPPCMGEVVGFLAVGGSPVINGPDSEMFGALFQDWTAAYPDWRDKPLVCIAVALSDFECEHCGICPGMHVLRWYPADDLEVVE